MQGRPITVSAMIRVTRANPRANMIPTISAADVMGEVQNMCVFNLIKDSVWAVISSTAYEKVLMTVAGKVLFGMMQNVEQRAEAQGMIERDIILPLRNYVASAKHEYGPARRIGKRIMYTGGMSGSIGYKLMREQTKLTVIGAGQPGTATLPNTLVIKVGAPMVGDMIGGERYSTMGPRYKGKTQGTSGVQSLSRYVMVQEYGSTVPLRISTNPNSPSYQRIAAWAQYKLGLEQPPRTAAKRRRKTVGRPRKYGPVPARAVNAIINSINKRGIVGTYVLRTTFKKHLPQLARPFMQKIISRQISGEDNYQGAISEILARGDLGKQIVSAITKAGVTSGKYVFRIE